MKTCPRCKIEKSFDSFRKNAGKRDGLQTYCIECSAANRKTHYDSNKKKVIEKNNKRAKLQRDKMRMYLFDYLSCHPCVDCGEADPVVLDFDHRGDKIKEVTAMADNGFSIEALQAEINKCDIRCANCHRRRHAKENESWRFVQAQKASHVA